MNICLNLRNLLLLRCIIFGSYSAWRNRGNPRRNGSIKKDNVFHFVMGISSCVPFVSLAISPWQGNRRQCLGFGLNVQCKYLYVCVCEWLFLAPEWVFIVVCSTVRKMKTAIRSEYADYLKWAIDEGMLPSVCWGRGWTKMNRRCFHNQPIWLICHRMHCSLVWRSNCERASEQKYPRIMKRIQQREQKTCRSIYLNKHSFSGNCCKFFAQCFDCDYIDFH